MFIINITHQSKGLGWNRCSAETRCQLQRTFREIERAAYSACALRGARGSAFRSEQKREGERDRQTDRQTDGQTDSARGQERARGRAGKGERERERERERETVRDRGIVVAQWASQDFLCQSLNEMSVKMMSL